MVLSCTMVEAWDGPGAGWRLNRPWPRATWGETPTLRTASPMVWFTAPG